MNIIEAAEEVKVELNKLVELIQNINNKNSISNAAMKIIKEMEWFYKTLLAKNYSISDIECYFINIAFTNIMKLDTSDDYYLTNVDSLIAFWSRSFLLKKYKELIDEKTMCTIIEKIGNFNFLNYIKKKNPAKLEHDGFFIKEFYPILIFIWKEIILKNISIISLDFFERPDFIIKFNYKDIKYIKPIEVTTLSNYSNYDLDSPVPCKKTVNDTYNTLLNKLKRKNEYNQNVIDEFNPNTYKILPTLVMVTSIYSFIREEKLLKIIDSIIEEHECDVELIKSLSVEKNEYNIINDNNYFYFLFYKLNHDVLEQPKDIEWFIYDEKFINLVIKKWEVDINKYELEYILFHIGDKTYKIELANYKYVHELKKGNELYKNIIKTLKFNTNNKYNIIYENKSEETKNMWIELYVSFKPLNKTYNGPQSFGIFKYEG